VDGELKTGLSGYDSAPFAFCRNKWNTVGLVVPSGTPASFQFSARHQRHATLDYVHKQRGRNKEGGCVVTGKKELYERYGW
jgi:hypothetical protein